MSCTLPEELLALHAGGDLAVAEAAEVESHVLTCKPCAKELVAYRNARLALQDLQIEAEPGQSLWAELDARLDAIDATVRHRLPWFRRMGPVSTLAAAAALILGVTFYPSAEQNNPEPAGAGDLLAQDSSTSEENPQLVPASQEDLLNLLYMPTAVPSTGQEPGETLLSTPAGNKQF